MRAVASLVLCVAMMGLTKEGGADLATAWTTFLATQLKLVRLNLGAAYHRRHRPGREETKSLEMMIWK